MTKLALKIKISYIVGDFTAVIGSKDPAARGLLIEIGLSLF